MAWGGGNKKKIQYGTVLSRRNSLSLSSSRSFRMQSHWSFQTGQCIDSEQFLRVHLSRRMCNKRTIYHKFRIDIGRTIWAKQRQYSLRLWNLWIKNIESNNIDLEAPRLACYHQKEWKELSKHNALGQHQTCSKESSIKKKKIDRHHSSRYIPSLLYPESFYEGNWRRHLRESIWRSSCKHVSRIWIPSRSIRATWCIVGTINCSQWNQGRSFFGEWHPITPESSIATISRTNRNAFTRTKWVNSLWMQDS